MHAFDVLGDPVRRRILELLAGGELTAGSIAATIRAEFDISQPGRIATPEGVAAQRLTSARRDGQRRLYAVNGEALRDIDESLAGFRRFWPRTSMRSRRGVPGDN